MTKCEKASLEPAEVCVWAYGKEDGYDGVYNNCWGQVPEEYLQDEDKYCRFCGKPIVEKD